SSGGSRACGAPALARGGGPARACRTLTARAVTLRCRVRRDLPAAADDVALVDPHLHADAAEGRLGLEEAVVDVRAQRVQRHPAFAVELRARHFGAAETARALHADALDLRLAHGRLDRLAHCAAEGDTVGQLLGDALRHQLRVRFRVLDLED